jgi:uncharacterized protein YfdQ (DUF2303 family)
MLTEDALKYVRSLDGVQDILDNAFPSRVVAIPEKSRVESLERFQAAPDRIKHKAVLNSSEAFAAYVNRFKTAETSVYLSLGGHGNAHFMAVLDHHGVGAPSWGEHKALFVPKFSLEWLAWKALHKDGPFNQAALVAFVEDHYSDLHEPSPAAMLTAVQKFEAVEKHTYHSAVNLDNGNVSITYQKDGATRKVEFPHTLRLWIPVLENEANRFLDGRLRYRTAEGSIAFTFQLKEDPERTERDALRAIAGNIKDSCEGCHHYEGAVG